MFLHLIKIYYSCQEFLGREDDRQTDRHTILKHFDISRDFLEIQFNVFFPQMNKWTHEHLFYCLIVFLCSFSYTPFPSPVHIPFVYYCIICFCIYFDFELLKKCEFTCHINVNAYDFVWWHWHTTMTMTTTLIDQYIINCFVFVSRMCG